MSIDGTMRVGDREVVEEASWRISGMVEHKVSARTYRIPFPGDFFFTCYATGTRVGLNVTRLINKNECHVEQDASGPKLAVGLLCPRRRRI